MTTSGWLKRIEQGSNMNKKANITNPHDKFFRETWSDRETAVDFIKNYLPGRILRHIDTDRFEICKDSFIEDELRDYFSDLLYKVSIDGEKGYLYFLFEHKSFGDKLASLQNLEYKIKIWRLDLKQRKKHDPISLPVVIPILLYHGKEKWTYGNSFGRLFKQYPSDLSVFVPNFEFVLVDLSEYEDEYIKGAVATRVTLMLFKHIFDPDIIEKLPKIISLLNELTESKSGIEYFVKFLRYLFSSLEGVSTVDELKSIFDKSLKRDKGGLIMTLEQQLINKGMQQGMQQGVHAMIETIEFGLTHKFGEIGLGLVEKIRQIQDLKKLKVIMETILQMDDVSEVEKQVYHC